MNHIETQREGGDKEGVVVRKSERKREGEKEGGWEREREKECYDVTPVVHWNTKAAERKTHTHTHTRAAAGFTNTTPPHSSPALNVSTSSLFSLSAHFISTQQSLCPHLYSFFILSFSRSLCILSLSLSRSLCILSLSLSLSLSCAEQLRLFWLELQPLIYLTAAFSPALFLIVALLPTSRVFCAVSLCVNVSVPGCLYCPSLTYPNSKSSLSASSQF